MSFDAKAKAKIVYGKYIYPALEDIEQVLLEAYQAGQKAAYEDATHMARIYNICTCNPFIMKIRIDHELGCYWKFANELKSKAKSVGKK